MSLAFFTNGKYREQKVAAWVAVGLLVFITSFLWAPSRDGLEAVYALAFFIPTLFVFSLSKMRMYFNCGWYFAAALVYTIYAGVTTLWSAEPDIGYFILQVVVLTVWLFGVTWLASLKEINVDVLMDRLIVVGILVGISLVVVFYLKSDIASRLAGWSVLRNPNSVGAVFGVLTFFAYLKWLESKSIKGDIKYFFAIVLLAVPLLMSQSRGAILALFVVAAISLLYRRPSPTKVFLHFLAAGVVFIGVLIKLDDLLVMFASRLDDGYRLTVWTEIFSRALSEHFWFGVGMEKEGRIIIPDVDVFNHAHNAWLDTFYRTGFIGLALALIHLFYLLSKFSPSKQLLPLYLWLLYGCLTAMVDSRGFFWQIDVRWFMYWIPAGLITALQILSHPSFSRNQHISDRSMESR